jgi:serine/threonine protein kinase
VDRVDRLKDFFEGEIRKIPRHVRRLSFSLHQRKFEIQFGELEWLWTNLPIRPQGLEGEGPGDGVIIGKDQVNRARSVLQRFRDAWITANENTDAAPTDRDKLLILEKMPKIAMVLWMARKHHLFNIFLENEIDDRDMDNNPYDQRVRECLPNDADYIGAQYSRAREREWNDGDHLKLSSSEPLPLRREIVYKDTPSITFVDKVRDSWHPEREYARKVLVVPEQFKTELINLKDICHEDHGHHLVKYVKTYERGEELGVLLSPVASQNLNDLLLTCSRKPVERQQNRPGLIQAFGCLAYGMCYLHNVKRFRHRDVKPHNILYLQKNDEEGEFMWSDFGLAYKFGQGVSGTIDQGFRATPQYEAPEIGKPSSIHGRSADVFSLGCVFLEIINVLSMGDKETNDRIAIRGAGYYKANIRALDQWAERKVGELRHSGERTLRKILEIGRGMIKEEPRHRLKIGEVALKLAELKPSGQNTPHPFCTLCAERRAKDRSKSPHHKDIFVHKKENWPKS